MPKDIKYLSERRKRQLMNTQRSQTIKISISNDGKTLSSDRDFNDSISSVQSEKEVPNKNTLGNLTVNDPPVAYNNSIVNDSSKLTDSEEDESSNDNCYTVDAAFYSRNLLKDELRAWISCFNISQRASNDLLQILRKNGLIDLPSNVRTLMSTPRNVQNQIFHGNGGSYAYFGLQLGLTRSIKIYYSKVPQEIFIQLNCDGASLSSSSNSQFWPLLACIKATVPTEPFLIALFHGESKPENVNVYLLPFVMEMQFLQRNDLVIDGRKVEIHIEAIICDAPARAFVTCTKNHSGYFGCSKCIQEGTYINSVTFPDLDCPLRTDHSFFTKAQEEHHTGQSILEQLNIKMVSNVVLDYMHLCCLGVMKRLLKFWYKGPKNVRLPKQMAELLSSFLLSIRNSIPSEFSRMPRSLHVIDHWKATECRQFLLYTGPVFLKSILPQRIYRHFLAFSVALRILCDPDVCFKLNEYAEKLLRWFTYEYGTLYGEKYISYNVHNLIHLAGEVKNHGNLNEFSAFKFENFLRQLKSKVKHSPKPLEQVISRISEQNLLPIPTKYKKSRFTFYKSQKTREITKVLFRGVSISTKHNDNCCLLKDSSIFVCFKFSQRGKTIFMQGTQISEPKSFFLRPFDSRSLNMFSVDNSCHKKPVEIRVADVHAKCFQIILPQNDCSVIMPLLHRN